MSHNNDYDENDNNDDDARQWSERRGGNRVDCMGGTGDPLEMI